jgi:hypothetical protein
VLVLASVSTVHSSTTTVTWYMRADTDTVNDVTGYKLNATQTNTEKQVDGEFSSKLGYTIVYFGWRIWLSQHDNSTVELTGGSPEAIVERDEDGMGVQTVTWTPPLTSLHVGYSALKMVLYLRFNGSSWTAKRTFTSDLLMYKSIMAETWSFKVWTRRATNMIEDDYWTHGFFKHGKSTCDSRITNMQFSDASTHDMMMMQLENADFVQFTTYPYTSLIGNLFYGLLLLIPCVSIYVRQRSFTPILILFIIFGGAGGAFTLLTPVEGLSITWVFLLLGLAGLLYRVFR